MGGILRGGRLLVNAGNSDRTNGAGVFGRTDVVTGAYIDEQLAPLAVFVAAAWRLFADAVRRRGDPAATPLILVFCALAVMSAAHEMLYQRAFWLLLGACWRRRPAHKPGDPARGSG